MNLLETIDHFIREQEGELESLSLEIREETYFEYNRVTELSEYWDYHKEHLENLKKIKELIVETNENHH